MAYIPEIFFDYKIDENHRKLNEGDGYVLYSAPCKNCPPPCYTVENSLKDAFSLKLRTLNPVQAKKFIDYHYVAYKGDKQDFITYVGSMLSKERQDEKVNFIARYLNERKRELEVDGISFTQIAANNTVKLKWNGQKNALIDIFRQLKAITNSDNEPLIASSYADISVFLKQNFVDFEETEISTILGQLKKGNQVKKFEKRVIIEYKSQEPNES